MIFRTILIFFVLVSSAMAGRVYPIWLYDNNIWTRSQIMHLQTQQQLQMQDQYSRMLLMQDQQRDIERLQDQQFEFELGQQGSKMRQHADMLRLYSQPLRHR